MSWPTSERPQVARRVPVGNNEELHDWQYASEARLVEDARSLLFRWYRSSRGHTESCTYLHQKRRNKVLRALAFIEAHNIAEKGLRAYIDSIAAGSLEESEDTGWIAGDAVDIVLSESRMQVTLAQETLEKYRQHVESIKSHYVCTILLHRLTAFVEQHARSGLLTTKEAQSQIARIEQSIQSAHSCDRELLPLVSTPNGPGSSSTR